MPSAFELSHISPQYLNVPDAYKYDYMVFRLAKILGCGAAESRDMSEKEFWMFMAFENLDNKRRQYFFEQERK